MPTLARAVSAHRLGPIRPLQERLNSVWPHSICACRHLIGGGASPSHAGDLEDNEDMDLRPNLTL